MEKKKKHSKKALFTSASTEIEEKGKKHQKQGPPGPNSKEKKEKKSCKGALLSSDSALEEKRKRKCQIRAPSNPPRHQDSVDQTGTHDCMCVGQGRGLADPMYDRGYLPPLGLGLVNKKYFHPGQSVLARMTCLASEFSGACPKYAFLSPSLQTPKLGRVGLQMTHPSQALGPLPRSLPIP